MQDNNLGNKNRLLLSHATFALLSPMMCMLVVPVMCHTVISRAADGKYTYVPEWNFKILTPLEVKVY